MNSLSASQLGVGLMNARTLTSAIPEVEVNSTYVCSFYLSPTDRDDAMKKLLLTALTLTMLAALSGCIVVPARGGYYHPHHDYRGW
jgi:hypothetical protein